MNWNVAIRKWDQSMQAGGLAEGTRQLRQYHVRQLADSYPAGPYSVTEDDIVTWFSDRYMWKPNTRRAYRASLNSFYRWTMRAKFLTDSPMQALPPVKVPRAIPRPAPNTVVDLALRTHDLRARTMIAVLAFTGMRRGELCKLHARDIESDVDESGDKVWSIRVIGKGERERIIPIDDELADMLRLFPWGYVFPGQMVCEGKVHRHGVQLSNLMIRVVQLINIIGGGGGVVKYHIAERLNSRQKRRLNEALLQLQADGRVIEDAGFYRTTGTPHEPAGHLSPKRCGEIVAEALGANEWTAHSLRHRYASLAYSVSQDIRAVQELLGHANVTTTQIYTFIPQHSVRRAATGARIGITA